MYYLIDHVIIIYDPWKNTVIKKFENSEEKEFPKVDGMVVNFYRVCSGVWVFDTSLSCRPNRCFLTFHNCIVFYIEIISIFYFPSYPLL